MKHSAKFLRKLFAAFIVMAAALPLWAYPLDIRIEPDTGIIFGTVNEYVYYNENGKTLSQLTWELPPRWYMGAKTSVYIFDIFFLKAEGKLLGLHGKTGGSMTDNDWQNIVFTDDEKFHYITDHSVHENFIEKYADLRISMGCSFEAPLLFRIEPSISCRLQKFSFAARNGFGQYGILVNGGDVLSAWDSKDNLRVYYHGDVISYTQNRLYVDAGLRFSTTLFPLMYFSAFVDISFLSWNTAIDNHHTRELQFRDTFKRHGFFPFGELSFGGDVFMVFGRRRTSRAGASFACQYVPAQRGTEEYMTERDKIWIPDTDVASGTDSWIWSISLSFSYLF